MAAAGLAAVARSVALPRSTGLTARHGWPLRRHACASPQAAASGHAAAPSAGRARRPLSEGGAAAAAAAASAAGLALAFGGPPVFAKEVQTRQEVYVWGRAEAIPGGAEVDVMWPTRAEWFDKNKAGWAKISFGPDFGAAVDKKGRLFLWGEGAEEAVAPVEIDAKGGAAGRTFIDVQCSSDKMFALTARGHVFIFEDVKGALNGATAGAAALHMEGNLTPGLPSPGKLNRLTGGGGIKLMAIGMEHAAFVTHAGDLYTVGGNEWGQCGIPPPRQKGPMGALEERKRVEVEKPTRVEMPEGAGPIIQVAVGGRHTLLQDVNGASYSFGDDRRIQLGLGDTRTSGVDERNSFGVIRQELLGGKTTKQELQRKTVYRYYDPHMQASPVNTMPPSAYNRPPYPPASFLACGEDFSIAIHRDSPDWYEKEKETNVLMCCGENGEGQCGRGLQEQQQAWTPVRMPKRSRTVKVSCGQAHCMALVSTGDLYVWGASLQGQLGNGKRASKARPLKIGLEPIVPEVPPEPKNVSPDGMPPELRQVGPEFRPFPGRISAIVTGFRNSAVICEVPVE